jgi:hypothetical protein
MNLTDVVNDPDIAESFIILRSTGGSFGPGGWTEPSPIQLSVYGIVSIADAKTIATLPEADQISEAIVINTETPIFVTRVAGEGTSGPGTSDIVVWNGDKYRVAKVHNYDSRGYWWAVAVRLLGA